MESVTLGFKACDAHELSCHFVARQAGLYRQRGLDVRLVDTTFLGDADLPQHTFHAACGAALTAWLRGADVRVVFVAAERPMFWIYGQPELRGLDELADTTVAGFPEHAPPSLMLAAVLSAAGVDTDRVTMLPVRDDVARVGLLRDGSVSAALVSSAVSPRSMERQGFRELLFLGDALQVPTTGLAVSGATFGAAPDLVTAVCSAYLEALELIHDESGVLESALAEFAGVPDRDQAALAARVRQSYTRTGSCAMPILEAAAAEVAAALDVNDARPVAGLYDFSRL